MRIGHGIEWTNGKWIFVKDVEVSPILGGVEWVWQSVQTKLVGVGKGVVTM